MKDGAETFILCEVGDATYALRSGDIQHIEILERVTPVPNAAPFVDGVIFSRGQVVPVVNLRKRFRLPDVPQTERSRIIITRKNERLVGLIVDSAREFRSIPTSSIQPINEAVIGISQHFLHGIAELDTRLVLLFDLEAIQDVSDLVDEEAAAEAISHTTQNPSASISS